MNLSSLKNTEGARRPRKRLGRGPGSGTGKTCGKGHKGQMARKGALHRDFFEGGQMPLYRRLPKRGFNHENKCAYVAVNVATLSCFEDGSVVNFEAFKAAGLANGMVNGVKVLGQGELTKKLTVKAQAFSKSAREKIEQAGGTCEVVERLK